jgi:diaminohydroxyphosphoribosylaminopyrimidine deaminase / 5-amino-6-(5-phosphoribosylamino)uracil reductase
MVASDADHMARALLLAERGRGRTSPNPMVGALVVDDEGVVVGRGRHEVAGGPHAEIHALADAGTRAGGATLYCTLEPCSHTGRTGPCAPRVVAAGIRRAVVAVGDPNPLVSGRGIGYLREHGVDVTVGVLGEQAERLNAPFFTRMRRRRPFVTMKVALSLDGCVAAAPGMRTQLTGPSAARAIHRERAEIDALAVGSGTVLADDPLLTARGIYRYRPLVRVVFDRRLRTPATARLFSTLQSGPVIIVTTVSSDHDRGRAQALVDAGARIEILDLNGDSSDTFLRAALERLAALEINALVVEGGPVLHEAFWRARLIDRVQLFVSPNAVGPNGVEWLSRPDGIIAGLSEPTVKVLGEDVMIEGHVHRVD